MTTANKNVLVELSTLRDRAQEIRAATVDADLSPSLSKNDANYGPALRYFLLFSEPELLARVDLGAPMDAVTAFYNQYYWFKRFVQLHHKEHGPDAGLDQQAFQLLESAPEGVDWDVLAAIEQQLERERA